MEGDASDSLIIAMHLPDEIRKLLVIKEAKMERGFFHVFSEPEWLLMTWQKQEERVRGGERLRRAVLAERQ